MPYMASNIPQSIFYSALVGEFSRIARSTLKFEDFVPKAKELMERMRKQGAESSISQRFLRKIVENHPESFSRFHMSTEDLIKAVF